MHPASDGSGASVVASLPAANATSVLEWARDAQLVARGALVSHNDILGPAMLALLVFGAAVFWFSLLLRSAKRHATPAAEVARTVGCYFMAVDSIVFTMIIPHSFDLLQDLGGTAVESGLVVGVFKFGTALGATFYFLLAQSYINIWRARSRSVLTLCALVNICSMGLYTFIGAVASGWAGHHYVKRHMIYGLVLSRIFGGCSAGVRSMMQRTHVARLTPLEQKPAQQFRLINSGIVGVGVGPLLASAVGIAGAHLGGSPGRYEGLGMVGMALAASQLFAALCLDSLLQAQDQLSADEFATATRSVLDREETQRRCWVMFFCFGFSMCRCLITSGLEVASAMILQTQLGWTHEYIGLIGVSFLAIIPIRSMFTRFWGKSTTAFTVRSLLAVSLLGLVFIFRCPPSLNPGLPGPQAAAFSGGVLLFGDALVNAGFFLSDGLVQGILMQHSLPHSSSLLNVNTLNLALVVTQDGVGRSVGPPLARFQVSHGGQSGYAAQQMLIAAVAIGLAVFGFLPLSERRRDVSSERQGVGVRTTERPYARG